MVNALKVILLLTPHNRNSLAAVANALEWTERISRIPVAVVRTHRDLDGQIERACADTERAVFAFSFTTLDLLEASALERRVRDIVARTKIEQAVFVAGGPHPSGAPEESLLLGFDYVVVGEGEIAFPALVAAIEEGLDPLAIKGVAALRDRKLHASGPAARPDLDDFPTLSRRTPLVQYFEITRGCPAACRFCQTSPLLGGRFRHRSVERLAEAVSFFAGLGRRDIRFVSADAFSYGAATVGKPNLEAVEELLRRLKALAPGLKLYFGSFPAEAWPGSVSERALELIRTYAVNDNIVMGAQSGSERTLARMHRPHTAEDVVNAVSLVLKHGFAANVDFIFGLPGEDEEDAMATVGLVRKLAAMGATIHGHAFIPLAGTPFDGVAPPDIPPRVVKLLDHLSGTRTAFGFWRRQHRKAVVIGRFRGALMESRSVEKALEGVAASR